MFKKLFFGLLIIAVLAIGAVSAYVSTIDWNQHKNKIAQQLQNISGKRIVFEGDISLALFPTPYLTAKNVKIYNTSGENSLQPLAIIRELVTDLSLLPLLKGNFVINNMSLLNPNILVEVLPDGKLNWYSQMSDEQRNTLEGIDIAFNSVMLKDASVQIINSGLKIDVTLQNLNAEISAQSLNGPYRIDGNFVKDNNPAGFALTLGTLSESFATSLNLVLTHPTTDSYARFDGSVLTSANEVKGNFIVESKNPSKFINELTNQTILPQEFNYPLVFSVELLTNSQQIDLSSFIIKYGEDMAGAGNVLIPLMPKPGEEKRTIEVGFEMTDLDLMPVMGMIKEQLKKYDTQKMPFEPYFDFDVIADLTAVKATYNNQIIRNFKFSADLVDDVLNVKNLSGLFPGDTEITVNGDVFENDKTLSYDFKVQSLSQDFLKFLNWVGIRPSVYAQSTYRSAQTKFGISGNLHQIKISPLSFSVDKTTAAGVIGIIREGKPRFFIALQSDSVNFDNYLPQLSEEEQKLPLNEKIKTILNKLAFLNKYDLHLEATLGLGIYNKTPFEKLNAYLDSENGVVTVQDFSIEDVASSNLKLSGKVSALGVSPEFTNVKYDYKTTDFKNFIGKFQLPIPNLPLLKNAKRLNAKGIFTGNLHEAAIKAVTSIDQFNSVYSGKLSRRDNLVNFKGMLEFKTPDFTSFVNSLGFDYRPQNMAANIFTYKTLVEGTSKAWKANDINAFIGSNNFKGNISFVRAERPQLDMNITANKFEFDRFIYNPSAAESMIIPQRQADATFLEKPAFSKTEVNYDFFKTFDLNGAFRSSAFSYGAEYFENAVAEVSINQGVMNVKKFSAQKEKGNIDGQFELNMNNNPEIKGQINLSNMDVVSLGGKKYAFATGVLKASAELAGPASSVMDFVTACNGKVSFDIDNTVFKGWNLEAIEDDLQRRTRSDGLFEILRDNLQKGQTRFELIGTEIVFNNGVYTLNNGLMASGPVTINFSGTGNLKNWDTNTNFNLVFEALRDKVVPIDFKWTGSLANPNLIVDSSALKNKYDNYWERIAKEKADAEKARVKALNDRMAQTKSVHARLSTLTAGEILPKLEKYMPLSSNAEVKSVYDSNSLLAIEINEQLKAMNEKMAGDYTDEDIDEMNALLTSFEPQLNEILKRINDNYVFDNKIRAKNAVEQIVNIYNNSKSKAVNYQKTLDAYVLRLLQLGSLVVLDRDPRAADYKNEIETSMRHIEDLNSKADSAHNIVSASKNISELELQNKILQELHDKTSQELEKLNTSLENLFEYAKTLVRTEEKARFGITEDQPAPSIIVIEDEAAEKMPVEVPSMEKPLLKTTETDVKPESPVARADEADGEPKNEIIVPNDIVSYQSKIIPSGKITRSGKVLESYEPKKNTIPESAPLLRPVTEKNVVSSGVIKKKK